MIKYDSLMPEALAILKNKHTEKPFSGKYHDKILQGSYLCRGCGAVLFRADSQFQSGCGWPSFDDEIPNAIERVLDVDNIRTEIICNNCKSHLGHVFSGEKLTAKNIRHCVNSLAIEFVADTAVLKTEEAIVAGGCFWGVEYLFRKLPGILLAEVGYTGGLTINPTYTQVCAHNTEHVEAVRIVFDSEKLSYEHIIKYFFEIHSPTQIDGQGPDIGSQYLSRIYYFDEHQKNIAEKVIKVLEKKGFSVSTKILPVKTFWPAEEDHQHYYEKTGHTPYCHRYEKRF